MEQGTTKCIWQVTLVFSTFWANNGGYHQTSPGCMYLPMPLDTDIDVHLSK